MKIEVDKKTYARLEKYVEKNGMASLSAAINFLLSSKTTRSRSTPTSTAYDIRKQYEAFVSGRVRSALIPRKYAKELDHLVPTFNINAWAMTNVEDVRQLYRRLCAGGDLHKISAKHGNGIMSAAVSHFAAFLESKKGG